MLLNPFDSHCYFLYLGAAYAVLPYVYQGGVEQFGWLSGTQMIDCLALGETTPGPLIMVVAFVGGWTKEIFGPDALSMAGAAAFVALFRFKAGIVSVIAGSAAIGLVYSLMI